MADFGTNENNPDQLDRGPSFVSEPEDAVYDSRSSSKLELHLFKFY